jgi:hypothetical protein
MADAKDEFDNDSDRFNNSICFIYSEFEKMILCSC